MKKKQKSPFEIIICNNKIIRVMIDDNDIELKDIKDKELLKKISNVEGWLKIHPLNNFFLDEQMYNDYEEFMTQKMYEVDFDCNNIDVQGSLIQALKDTMGIDIMAIHKAFDND
jgi:hypothetical protein